MLTVDTTTSSGMQNAVASYSWAHTVSGIERYLYLAVGTVGTTVSSATYAFSGTTKTFTQIRTDVNGTTRSTLLGLVDPPPGAGTITVNLASAVGQSASGAVSLNGVDPSNAVNANNGATGTGTTPSVTVTPAVDQSVVLDHVYAPSNVVLSPNASQLINWNIADAATVQVTASGLLISLGALGPVTSAWTAASSIGWVANGVALTPLRAKMIAPTERPIDPTTPSAGIGRQWNVTAY